MNRKVCVFAGFGLCLFLSSHARAAACSWWHSAPDGRIREYSGISSSTEDLSVAFRTRTNKSYSVEVWVTGIGYTAGTLSVNVDAGDCPTSDVSGLTHTETNDPSPEAEATGFYRVSFTPAAPADWYSVRIGNTSPDPLDVALTISETTQYNPRWSTYGGYTSQWGLQNTSSATVNGTLKVYTTAGTQVASETFAISPGRVVFKTSTGYGIAANQSGNAIFTHDGPPGAIQADAYMISADVTTVVPSKFEPVREAAH